MHPTRPRLRIACTALAVATLSTMSGAQAADETAAVATESSAMIRPTPEGGERGNASYYSRHLSGRFTASGERYDPEALTAAHRTLPLGTRVRVFNPKNDRSVVVTVNDRGPVSKNRVMDLSSAAAELLGMTRAGVLHVLTEIVERADRPRPD